MKARNYREVKGVAYTRTKFIHGAPLSKITKFTTGDPSKKFEYKFILVSDKRLQIRFCQLPVVIGLYDSTKLLANSIAFPSVPL